MSRVLALARITCLEGIRNRSVFGILLFSLFILGLNVAVAGFFMRDIGKVTVDMNLAALSFSGLLLVFFVALGLMAKDIDRRTIQIVLSKPISRTEYVFGKYLGLLAFIAVSLLVLLTLSSATILLIRGLYPAYFGDFSWSVFYLAAFFVLVRLAVVSAIVVFFCTLTTNSFIALIFSICAYIVGQSIEEVIFYLRSASAAQEPAISASLQRFIEVVSYIAPNLSVFNFQLEAAHGLAVSGGRIAFALGYGATYIVVVLLLASWIFRRREFN